MRIPDLIGPGSSCLNLETYFRGMEEKDYANSYICCTRATSGHRRGHELHFNGKTWYPVQPGDIGKREFKVQKFTNPRTGQTITLYS